MKEFDIISIGEALIDYIPIDNDVCGRYLSSVGGAPLNVAVGLAKMGGKAAFIGRVGDDSLGKAITKELNKYGVCCSLVQYDRTKHTTITICMPQNSDMQRYIIYRDNSADIALDFNTIGETIFQNTHFLHIGALLNINQFSAQKMFNLIKLAREQGAMISFDVNMRPGCWENEAKMIEQSLALAEVSDIIKVTDDEKYRMSLPIDRYSKEGKIILVTDNERDINVFWKEYRIVEKVRKVDVADVTGAGDAFFSAFLFQYCKYLNSNVKIEVSEVSNCARIGMLAGSHSVQYIGAHQSFPTYNELINKTSRSEDDTYI